jgi:hypothetical protein
MKLLGGHNDGADTRLRAPLEAGPGNRMAADLERFGKHMYDSAADVWPSACEDFVAPMYERYRADQGAFLVALAEIAEEREGWVAYGAERLMIEIAGGNIIHPACKRIMDASLEFLRASKVPSMMVTGYEWKHWLNTGEDTGSWAPCLSQRA